MKKLILLFFLVSFSLFSQTITEISKNGTPIELDDEFDRFALSNLTDKSTSPWCLPASDWTKDDNFEIILDKKMNIDKLFIANGFYDARLFGMNARPSKAVLKNESGETREVTLKDNFKVETYSFKPLNAKTLTLSFPETKKGSKYQDLCVGEFSFEPISDESLNAKKKEKEVDATNKIKNKILFVSAQGESDIDQFTIVPNGKNYSIEPNAKSKNSIILYQPYSVTRLLLQPSTKVKLVQAKSSYDITSFAIEGNCETDFDGKKKSEVCKITLNPVTGNYKVYINKKLTFQSKHPDMFQ